MLRVASAFVSYLEEGSTPERHCAAEDGRVEASTTSELDCIRLQAKRNESYDHHSPTMSISVEEAHVKSMQVEIRNYILC